MNVPMEDRLASVFTNVNPHVEPCDGGIIVLDQSSLRGEQCLDRVKFRLEQIEVARNMALGDDRCMALRHWKAVSDH